LEKKFFGLVSFARCGLATIFVATTEFVGRLTFKDLIFEYFAAKLKR
jgi:hypothetical protein